jgi:hypothetical protein
MDQDAASQIGRVRLSDRRAGASIRSFPAPVVLWGGFTPAGREYHPEETMTTIFGTVVR